MKILYFAHAFWPYIGGIEVIAARLLPALVRRGHDVAVLTVQGDAVLPDEEDFQGVAVHRVRLGVSAPELRLGGLAAARERFSDLVERLRPDVVHVNSVLPPTFPLLSAAAPQVPVLLSLHGDVTTPAAEGGGSLVRRMLESAAWVTACSTAVLECARRLVPAIAARSSMLPGFLTLPPIESSPPPFDPPVVFAASRLVPDKGLDVLLRALPAVRARWPAVRAVIAGDGPARHGLQSLAAELGLQDAVTFAGWVPPGAVWSCLDAATLVAMPSRAEPFGMAAIEAAAMARPVVAARVGGLPEAVRHGRTGLLVDPDNAPALASALTRLLAHPELARAMGARAREHAATYCAGLIEIYEALYRRTCSSAQA